MLLFTVLLLYNVLEVLFHASFYSWFVIAVLLLQAMPYFKCQNCKYKLHQCFSCGQLGSSDKEKGVEV